MPLLRLAPPDDWPTLGWGVVDWIEAYLLHGPGDVEGEPIILDDELVLFFLDCYRIYPRGHQMEGKRVVREATLSRPKGRAKSEIAGMGVCVEALGPVRFDGWDAAGDPVGRPVKSPFIRCLATEKLQAGNTYDNVQYMLEAGAEAAGKDWPDLDVGATRTLVGRTGEIRPSTAGAASKDGGKETFAVADEPHLYVLPEHRAMYATVSRNLRKRKAAEPWMLRTTTMYRPGQGSPAETRHEWARKHERVKHRDLSVLFDHREAPKVNNWDDDDEMLAALAEGYGDFAPFMDLLGVLSEIRDSESDLGDSQRYWLNQRAEYADAAFDLAAWDALGTTEQVEPGSKIVLGFDGARFDDATAIVAADVQSGQVWLVGLWEDDGVGEFEVPPAEVTDALAATFDRYQVLRMYADPPYWADEIAGWQGRWGGKVVTEWWTNRAKAVAYACHALATAIRAGDLTHDGSPGLRRHIANAYREDLRAIKDPNGRSMWRIRKERKGSPRKMDAAMATVLAWEARSDAIAAGALTEAEFYVPHRIR